MLTLQYHVLTLPDFPVTVGYLQCQILPWNLAGKKSNLKQTRKPSWRKGYERQRHHSKMTVSRHLGYYRTGNSAMRSADPKNACLEWNVEWIGCTACEILAFKPYCDLQTKVRGKSRSSKVALFDRAHATLYSSSIVTMPLSITVSEI